MIVAAVVVAMCAVGFGAAAGAAALAFMYAAACLLPLSAELSDVWARSVTISCWIGFAHELRAGSTIPVHA